MCGEEIISMATWLLAGNLTVIPVLVAVTLVAAM